MHVVEEIRHKKSNLGVGRGKSDGGCYNVQKLTPASSPNKTEQDNRINQFSLMC